MSLHVELQIMNMIENWSPDEEHQFNPDSVYDFVIERLDCVNMYRFENIDSIVKWLCDGGDGDNGEKKIVAKSKRCVKSTFKKGIKIKIQKPKDSVPMFNDIGKALAVLERKKQNQSKSDVSGEIDVITIDNNSSPWNSYAMAAQENRQNINVLTEIHSIAMSTPFADVKRVNVNSKRKRSNFSDENHKEPKFLCNYCEKKYQQKSSLSRHEKKYHEIIHPSAKRPKNNNYNLPAPINTEM